MNKLSKYYINYRGWSINRKLLIIESDDWGSIRIASKKNAERISYLVPNISSNQFDCLDGLERTIDLEDLLTILAKFKDKNGSYACLTALYLTGNPDLSKIRENKNEYYFQDLQKTYEQYGQQEFLDLVRNQGIDNNLFFPQFHGREHLFPERYLRQLQDNKSAESIALNNSSVIGFQNGYSRELNYLASFEYFNEEEKSLIELRLVEGLKNFERLFGFKSVSICPPQSIYGDHIFECCKLNGVKAIQAGQQYIPEGVKLKKVNHFWGDRTSNDLIFWRRNCTFEPYKDINKDHVDSCLKEVEIAFKLGKPAVINSHRINFTSRIGEDIKDKTLKDLFKLLKKIQERWPDVEFINSAQLFEVMNKES